MSHWNTDTILGLARNFMESRILLTGAELDLFTLLADRPLSAEEIQSKLGADLRALTNVLDALAAMGLLIKQADKYQADPAAASVLSANSPTSVLPMVLHCVGLWNTWSGLTGKVRATPASAPMSKEDSLRAFIGAMHVIGEPVAANIVKAVKPGPARKLLDVGGASGTYVLAFLAESPQLKATLFDRPDVIEMARERLSGAGVLDRVTLAPGDFYQDELPAGHDLAFVSAIIHQNSLDQNVDLYSKVYRALEPGGRIVIRDHVMNEARTEPRAGAIFAINMLAGTPGGGTFTFDEIRAGLEKAGFTRVGLVQNGERMDALVEAFKP